MAVINVGVYLVWALVAADLAFSCSPVKEGCFQHDDFDEYLLHSDKTEHAGEKFHSGVNIDWEDFEKYLMDAICRCEKAAAKARFEYFSLRNFGECHGLRNLPKEKSAFCVHHSFEQCATDDEKCVGADQAEFVYKVVEKSPTVKPDVTALKIHHRIICQFRGAKTIACKEGETIKIIKGFYGRTSKKYCSFKNHHRLNCKAKSSEMKIKKSCNGKRKCRLKPRNRVYGNPCRGTRKYLDIAYVCLPGAK